METPKKLDLPIMEQWWKGKTLKTTQLWNNGGWETKTRRLPYMYIYCMLMHLYKLLLQEKQGCGYDQKAQNLSINDDKRW